MVDARVKRAGVFLLPAACLLATACSQETEAPATTAAPSPTVSESAMLSPIVDTWQRGERDTAVAKLLQQADCGKPTELALYTLSEAEFVALPAEERDRLRPIMVDRYTQLRDMYREVERRARTAWNDGRQAEARKMRALLQCLSDANRGPQRTKFANLIGDDAAKSVARLTEHFEKSGA